MTDPITFEMGRLFQQLQRFRAGRDALQVPVLERMMTVYGQAHTSSLRQYEDLANKVRADIQAGQSFSVDRLRRMTRYQDLMRDTLRRMEDFAQYASDGTLEMQRQAIAHAERETYRLMQSAVADDLVIRPTEQGRGALPPGVTMDDIRKMFHRLPEGALDDAIGITGDGTPLREYFLQGGADKARFPPITADVIDRIDGALTKGLAGGWGPARMARQFANAMGVGLERSLRIARTEALRVSRLANHAIYMANSDVVIGWRWLAALGPNTCAACIAMDGTVHSHEEVLNDHPSGACVPAPVTRLSVDREIQRRVKNPDGSYSIVTGDGKTWFAGLPQAQQKTMLGPAGFKAWKAGRVELNDFVGANTTETFGTSIVAKSLVGMIGDGAQGFYVSAEDSETEAAKE